MINLDRGDAELRNIHVLFIETNRSGYGYVFLRVAKELGCKITMAVVDPAYYLSDGQDMADSPLRFVDRFVVSDTHNNIDDLQEQIMRLHRADPIQAVMATGDLEVQTAAKLADALGLPGNDPDAVYRARNKCLMRESLNRGSVPQPWFARVTSPELAAEAVGSFGGPCLIKPADATDSAHVRLIQSPADIELSFSQHFREPAYGRGYVKHDEMLVEEYIEGPLYSVEIVLTAEGPHVLGISDRELSAPPYFAEVSVGFPFVPDEHEVLISTALASLSELGLEFGAFHVELVVRDGQAFLIEVNPRLIGVTAPFIMDELSGTSCAEQIIRLHAGGRFVAPNFRVGYGIHYYLFAERPGRLAGSNVGTVLAHQPDVIRYDIRKHRGDPIGPATANTDAVLSFTLVTDSKSRAMARVNQILEQIHIEYM